MTLIVSKLQRHSRTICFAEVYRDIRKCAQSPVIGCSKLASMRESRRDVVLHDAASKVKKGRLREMAQNIRTCWEANFIGRVRKIARSDF